jgi:hypothetical protein
VSLCWVTSCWMLWRRTRTCRIIPGANIDIKEDKRCVEINNKKRQKIIQQSSFSNFFTAVTFAVLLWAIPKWNNGVCSIKFIQWYCLIKSPEYLSELITGENGVGSKRREREREKESSRLTEWETECWTEMEIAWVRDSR